MLRRRRPPRALRDADRIGRHAGGPLILYEGSVHGGGHGGARFHFTGLSAALFARVGHSLHLIVPRFRGVPSLRSSLPPDVQIVELASWRRGAPGFLLYELKKALLYLWLAARSPHHRVVLLTRISYHGVSTLVARALGWRVILEVNGVPAHEARDRRLGWATRCFISLASRAQARWAHELITVTPGIADEIGSPARVRVHVVPNGVDLSRFPAIPAERAKSRNAILFVGTLAPWQDVALLLRAVQVLGGGNDGDPWELTIVGKGEQEDELHVLADELGIADRVRFVGWQPHELVSTFIADAWICAVPLRRKHRSRSCGSPLKLFEYLASNRPVVAAEVDGVRELTLPLIQRYDEGNLSSLVAALHRASTSSPLDPATLEEMRVEMSWNNRADRVLSIALASEPR